MEDIITYKTLLGHKNLDFSIECLQSFLNNSSKIIHLQIFEDGTINGSDERKLLSELKNSVIISKTERDKKINEKLKNFPKSLAYRNNILYAQKIFDVMLFDQEDLFFIDSDVYFIKKFELPVFNTAPVFMFDSENAYSFHPLDFLKINIPIFPKVNSGFFYFPNKLFNLPYIEELLTDPVISKGYINRIPWLEQTIWSFLSAKNNTINYFNKNHVLIAGKELKLTDETIAVHLVSTFRNHFENLKLFSQKSNGSQKMALIEIEKQGAFLNKIEFSIERIIKKTKRHLSI